MDFNQRIARAAKRRGGLLVAAAMVLLVALGLGLGRDSALADPATERAVQFVAVNRTLMSWRNRLGPSWILERARARNNYRLY